LSYGGIALGAHGERLAAEWYKAHGYVIVTRNWKCEIGEIDLIVRRGNEVVVAEVKTRVSDRFGAPFEAVGFAKQRKLRQLAATFLKRSAVRCDEVRFDVVSIIGRDVEVIEAAF
jgi:putative endonuclease